MVGNNLEEEGDLLSFNAEFPRSVERTDGGNVREQIVEGLAGDHEAQTELLDSVDLE